MARNTEYPESVIGQSVKVEGDLISDGDLQIEGQVKGKVRTSRNLFVGNTAKLQADIEAQNATIAGLVEGDIKVSNTLVILETGKVLGNAFCSQFGVREGAYFAGQVSMDEGKASKASASSEE